MIGTCGKCARLVNVLKVGSGHVADAHGAGGDHVCSGAGLAVRGLLDTEAPAPVDEVEQDDDWGPTPEQEAGWDAREDWLRGNALG